MKPRYFVPLCMLFLLSQTPAAKANDGMKEAKIAFQEGTSLFDQGDYKAAAEAFRRANALYPNWVLLYNVGQSETAAKEYGLAYEAFEEYLAQGGDEIPEARRAEVVSELERLAPLIGAVEVVAPDGSVVRIDGQIRGVMPIPGKPRISVGVVHTVEIVLSDAVIHREQVKVIRGEVVKILATPPDKENPEAAAVIEDKQETSQIQRRAAWITMGSGAAVLIGGGITGALALARNSELDTRCEQNACYPDDQEYAQGRDRLAVSSTILFGVGIAGVGTGFVLLMLTRKKNGQSETVRTADNTLSVAPFVGMGTSGFHLSGTF